MTDPIRTPADAAFIDQTEAATRDLAHDHGLELFAWIVLPDIVSLTGLAMQAVADGQLPVFVAVPKPSRGFAYCLAVVGQTDPVIHPPLTA